MAGNTFRRVARNDYGRWQLPVTAVFYLRIEACIIHACETCPGTQLPSARCCLSRLSREEDRTCSLRNLTSSKPPVKTEQRGRILGIGGVFFKSANRDQAREWYAKHLGLADKGEGAMLPWREHDDPKTGTRDGLVGVPEFQ